MDDYAPLGFMNMPQAQPQPQDPQVAQLLARILSNPIGTDRVAGQSMSAADPGFQPGVNWGGSMVSQPFYEGAHNTMSNALGWVGSSSPRNVPPAFADWFGASKVAKDGMPLQVYHGTNSSFSDYSPQMAGAKTGNVTTPLGHFFTDNPAEASRYATGWTQDNANVRPSYLSLQNPYEMSHREFDDLAMSVFRGQKTEPEALAHSAALRDELQGKGHDGIIIPGRGQNPTQYVVFNPQQAKSAIEVDAAAAQPYAPLGWGGQQ